MDGCAMYRFTSNQCPCRMQSLVHHRHRHSTNPQRQDVLYSTYICRTLQYSKCRCSILPLRTLFHPNLLGVHVTTKVLHHLLHTYLPKLAAHLDTIHFSIAFFTDWIMTLFTSIPNLPLQTVVRIWDFFIIEGATSLYKLLLAMLSIQEDVLVQLDMEAVYLMLKRYPVIDMFSIEELYPIIDTFTFTTCDVHTLQCSALVELCPPSGFAAIPSRSL
uniref:Small G protein signaling modulator 3 n=1 Tax=Lygus hesperus TaxID=30085 RepID=A0A0A9XBW9_LYGHE